MAALLIGKNEPNERIKKKNENCVLDCTYQLNKSFTFTVFDLAVLILSVVSIIIDMCTDEVTTCGMNELNKFLFMHLFFNVCLGFLFCFLDLVLVVQYSSQGYKAWAISTFVLIFLPSIVVQFFSLRWHIVDKTANLLHWVLHFCMLGVVHRYIQVIKNAVAAYKSKNSSDVQKVLFDQSDLCMLHLFESFLESAPQLVLQIYVILMVHEWRFWTGVSAVASLLSLAWALASYTKAQRRARPNKNSTTWPCLLLQAIWRTGMLTSRISTLVLGAYCFGNYIFLILIIHWIAMTVWIISQKTDFCDTYWEEKIYNAIVGIIYCFCFFNLQEGHSRWRALAFYLVIIFQNLICLTIYLTWFGEKTPKLALTGFIAIVGGTIIGSTSMLFYYRFFHPSGPIKFFFTQQSSQAIDPSPPYASMTLRSLKRIRCETQNKIITKSSTQTESQEVLNKSSHLDSIIVVEETVLDNSDNDIKILQNWINSEHDNKSTESASKTETKETETDIYKRRPICSSVDLVKLSELKPESENGSLKLAGTDEASSEILSAHDYENLCAVNIAREAWGLRSWRGYSDIETWLHDDSVVHDRRLDTLTSTSSDRSANTLLKENERTRQDDYMDAIGEDLAQCESEASTDDILGQYSIEALPVVYPLGTLDPIFEEIEESSTNSAESTDVKIRNDSSSTLVATIDEIRRNRYPPSDNIYGFSHLKPRTQNWKKVKFASKFLTFHENDLLLVKDETIRTANVEQKNNTTVVETRKNEKIHSKTEEKNYCKNKKKEINVPITRNLTVDSTECCEIEINNKENISTVANKINHWNKILSLQNEKIGLQNKKLTPPKKRIALEKKSFFLLKVLTPPHFPTFQRQKES